MTAVEVELVGGARDGAVFGLDRAPESLVMPCPVTPVPLFVRDESELVSPQVPDVDVYHRCVMSDVTHRWRYVLGPHDGCRTWPVPL